MSPGQVERSERMVKNVAYLYSVIIKGAGGPDEMMAKYLLTRMHQRNPEFVSTILKHLVNADNEPQAPQES